MPARTPEDMSQVWSDTYNRGDLDGLMELYEPSCVFVTRSGETVTGRDAIREYFRPGMVGERRMTVHVRKVIRNGDLALCQGEWTLQRVDPAGAPSEIVGRSVEVLRRQPDGTWCYLIDDPFAGEERAAR